MGIDGAYPNHLLVELCHGLRYPLGMGSKQYIQEPTFQVPNQAQQKSYSLETSLAIFFASEGINLGGCQFLPGAEFKSFLV